MHIGNYNENSSTDKYFQNYGSYLLLVQLVAQETRVAYTLTSRIISSVSYSFRGISYLSFADRARKYYLFIYLRLGGYKEYINILSHNKI